MTLNNPPLSTRELQQFIRGLSAETLTDITGISNPAYQPIIRKALFAWVLDCGAYFQDEHDKLFEDFMLEAHLIRTASATLMHNKDREEYSDFFIDIVKEIPSNSYIIQTTQFIGLDGTFLGSRITCGTPGPDVKHFWVCIKSDWNYSIYFTQWGMATWLEQLAAEYSYDVYGRVSVGWTRTLSGRKIVEEPVDAT